MCIAFTTTLAAVFLKF
uniref:Uncharacterized protein n=1 Tax=Anguilla anguilla TaxID=7936 RepID=A0A0E9UU19_ANGAN